MTKTYSGFLKHEHIKINAEVHLSDKWEGELIFLMADDVLGINLYIIISLEIDWGTGDGRNGH